MIDHAALQELLMIGATLSNGLVQGQGYPREAFVQAPASKCAAEA